MNATPSKPALLRYAAAALLAAAVSGPALAHHSGGVFDRNSEVRLMGVVKAVEWTNPHAWIEINVANAAGKNTQWSVELDSPNVLRRHGWRAGEIKTGDRLTVIAHPTRDGRPTGAYISVLLPNGKVLGRGANVSPGT
jgi:hypothetical protein